MITQAAVLAGLSDGRQGEPDQAWCMLARRIIAEPPDDPPPNVPNLKQETEHLPLRARLEMHRNQAGCAQCHSNDRPYGIPFEEYDAGGKWLEQSVDSRSQLPDGASVAGANDLKRYLAHDRLDQVAFSFLKHMTTYACGRDLSYYELEFIRQNGQQFKAQGYPTGDLLRWVVHSPMFLEK